MIKSIDFPTKSFSSKEELFAELKDNLDELIDLKKSNIKHSESISLTEIKEEISKAIDVEDGYINAVINTTKFMDSHNDVHMDGIWGKSVKEQQGKIYYLADHAMKLDSIIAFPKDVKIELKFIDWKSLGLKVDGESQALIFKVLKDKIRMKSAKEIIDEKIQIQHSVRMKYEKIFLCINSELEDYKDEKKNWDKYIKEVINADYAEKVGYFWAVTEAQIYKEGSMVIAGSNEITPLLQKEIEAVSDTSKTEPLKDTQLSIYSFN